MTEQDQLKLLELLTSLSKEIVRNRENIKLLELQVALLQANVKILDSQIKALEDEND